MAAGTSDSDPLYYSFAGREPPELAADGTWLTAAPAPSLYALRGQVVFVFFAFQGCPSCALMTPYLQQWHQMFGPQGLTVVYVNNGLMANDESARKAIAAESLAFPYFHDAKGETLRQYGIRSFPTAYLIDRQGKVVWEGAPVAIEAQVQAKIVELLK
jgi:thiol-disulfide isomerase/thioredoxin